MPCADAPTPAVYPPVVNPNVDDVELATLGWMHWWNTDRIHSYLDDLSPDQFEAAYAASNTDQTDQENQNIQPAQNPG